MMRLTLTAGTVFVSPEQLVHRPLKRTNDIDSKYIILTVHIQINLDA